VRVAIPLPGRLAASTGRRTFELMRERSSSQGQRAGWSAVVWIAVILSGLFVRVVNGANDSAFPFAFPLAAVWVIGAVSAAHWTARRWIPRHG